MSAASRSRVLVIDDDPSQLAALEGLLALEADITTCASPSRALGLFDLHPFDVVCSDYQMPEMDGLSLLEAIRKRSNAVGCILLTGADTYARAKHDGHCYVLGKPYDPRRLVTLVTQLGSVARMRRAAT